MSNNQSTVQRFLTALERRDASPIEAMLTEDVVQILPFAASGGSEPAAPFTGRAEVLQVQETIVAAFTTVEFADPVHTVSGDVVFVETRGRRVQKDTGRVYENFYVLKFEFADGLIRRITEYSNPVAFAAFFGLPLG